MAERHTAESINILDHHLMMHYKLLPQPDCTCLVIDVAASCGVSGICGWRCVSDSA